MNVDIQLLALPIHVSTVNAMFLLRSYIHTHKTYSNIHIHTQKDFEATRSYFRN